MSKRIVEINLDASALKESACKFRLKRIVLDGFREKLNYNDTQYGSAFHLFVKVMYHTAGDFGEAILAANNKFSEPCNIREGKKHLTELHLNKTCIDYWNHFKKNDQFEVMTLDGKPAVEVDFRFLYYIEETTDTIYQVYLCGTIDAIGKFNKGCYAFKDYKTNSLWKINKNGGTKQVYVDAEIRNYFKQYELSCQLRFYAYCLRLYAQLCKNEELKKILSNPMASFIDGIFLSPKDPTQYHRSPIRIYEEKELTSFGRSLDGVVKQLVWLAQHPEYEEMDGIVCGACNENKFPCKFWRLCETNSAEVREFLFKDKFKVEPYNPMLFGK